MAGWNTVNEEKTKADQPKRPPVITLTIVLFMIIVLYVAIASLISSIGGY